jgi:hypothetical protein
MRLTITSTYYGRTSCAWCGRVCGISEPVKVVDGTVDGYADGPYCRRCSARVLDVVSAEVGIDEQAVIVAERDHRYLVETSANAERLAHAVQRNDAAGIRDAMTRLGFGM